MVGTIIIDVDGVLTDGKVHYDARGERIKSFHSRDIRAIRQLISHGFEVILLTQSSWPGVNDYVNRTGADVIIDREKKLPEGVKDYYMIGDDTPDIALMKGAVKSFCPMDADSEVVKYCTIINCNGGEGVVAEFIKML